MSHERLEAIPNVQDLHLLWVGCVHAGAENGRTVAAHMAQADVAMVEVAEIRTTKQGEKLQDDEQAAKAFTDELLAGIVNVPIRLKIDLMGDGVDTDAQSSVKGIHHKSTGLYVDAARSMYTDSTSVQERMRLVAKYVSAAGTSLYKRDVLCARQITDVLAIWSNNGARKFAVMQGAAHIGTLRLLQQHAGLQLEEVEVPVGIQDRIASDPFEQLISHYIDALRTGTQPTIGRTGVLKALARNVIIGFEKLDIEEANTRVQALSIQQIETLAAMTIPLDQNSNATKDTTTPADS